MTTASHGWHAAQWAALGAWATVAVYVVLGVFAYIQIVQAKKLREQQSRPYVIVDFAFRGHLLYLVVKNIGSTPARKVQASFDPPLRTTRPRDLNKASFLASPIPMMAPGREISAFFDTGPQVIGNAKVPQSYVVTLAYEDVRGKRYRDPPSPLDLSHLANASLEPAGLPELVREVETLRREITKWTDGSNGILAYTVDRNSFHRWRDRPWLHEQGQGVRKEKGNIAYVRWLVGRLLGRFGWR